MVGVTAMEKSIATVTFFVALIVSVTLRSNDQNLNRARRRDLGTP